MKKNKENAFTLIELLAVIVILALVALIAVPIILDVINKANESAFKDSAYGIIQAGEYYFAQKQLQTEYILEEKMFEFPNNIQGLEISGNLPTSGSMIINAEGDIALGLSNGRFCATKGYDDSDIEIIEIIPEDCYNPEAPKVLAQLVTISDEVTEVNECRRKGKICPNGTNRTNATAFAIKVSAEDENEIYNFYVIDDDGYEITLIMDRNLGKQVQWHSSLDNTKGPTVAVAKLKERTKDWTNIPERNYIYSDDGGGSKYESFKETMRATMLTYTQYTELVEENKNSIPKYLYKNLSHSNTIEEQWGYWLSAAVSTNSTRGMLVDYSGQLNYYMPGNANRSTNFGLRPVITLKK